MEPYSLDLDRFDTAIRAVVALAKRGRKGGSWNLLREIGVSRDREAIMFLLIDSGEWFRDDEGLAKALRIAPWLLDAAQRLLAKYHAVSAMNRTEFYKRTKGKRVA